MTEAQVREAMASALREAADEISSEMWLKHAPSHCPGCGAAVAGTQSYECGSVLRPYLDDVFLDTTCMPRSTDAYSYEFSKYVGARRAEIARRSEEIKRTYEPMLAKAKESDARWAWLPMFLVFGLPIIAFIFYRDSM